MVNLMSYCFNLMGFNSTNEQDMVFCFNQRTVVVSYSVTVSNRHVTHRGTWTINQRCISGNHGMEHKMMGCFLNI